MAVLASYRYSYGAGSEYNRIIEFIRMDSHPSSLLARVSTLGIHPRIISSVPAYSISVEFETTTQKAASLLSAYHGNASHSLKVNTMDDLGITPQKEVCDRIRPNFHDGSGYRIEVTNDVGGPDGYERVVQLNLFDPS